MANKKPSAFMYYYDWAEEMLKLPNELRLKIDDAMKRFVLYGEEPTDPMVIYSMFSLMRKQAEEDIKKYEQLCKDRQRAINTRWEREREIYTSIQPNTSEYTSIQPNTSDTNKRKGNKSKLNETIKENTHIVCTKESATSVRFTPPSIEEVRMYVSVEGLDIDAEEFMDYGIANGWKLSNGNPMKDWRATLRQWHRRKNQQKENQQRKGNGQQHTNIADTLHPQMCDYGESTI